MSAKWLDEAIFYEIYPQSFKDSNGDGIGDIQGIIEKLDYIKDLGFNAIWLNPCFDSSFVDAGYDVKDFYKVAPRYGTNQDLKELFTIAHSKGIHVILDLVAGHTSVDCNWFKQSCLPYKNEYSDRYIWSDSIWNAPNGIGNISGWLRGGYDRDGSVAVNFFTSQVALNYGFYEKDEGCNWQQSVNDNGPIATREELKNIMRFWLSMGCDGFRVDMAGSLVKNDPQSKGTIALWQNIKSFLNKEFPQAVLVSEWGEPDKALEGGFDMDFLLHFGPSHYLDLFRSEKPYFSSKSLGDLNDFWQLYQVNYQKALNNGGMICIPSGNHDMDRLAKTLNKEEEKIAFAFLLSMPGVPFVYYGDEIGMNYVNVAHSKEGGFFRTGSRTPMQWDTSLNAGFSSGKYDELYLPLDIENKDTINVQVESKDNNSLYNEVKKLLSIRKNNKALTNRGEFKLISYTSYPLIYERKMDNEIILVILNPSNKDIKIDIDTKGNIIYSYNNKEIVNNVIPSQSAFYIKK